MDERLKPLSQAFWVSLMEDLVGGELEAYLWLYTGEEPMGFLWWCEVTGKDKETWHAALLALWRLRGTQNGKKALKKLREAVK